MLRCELVDLVDSGAYINALMRKNCTTRASIRMEVMKEVIGAVLKGKNVYFNNKTTERSSCSYIINTVMLSKMLFNTVHLTVHKVNFIFY